MSSTVECHWLTQISAIQMHVLLLLFCSGQDQ